MALCPDPILWYCPECPWEQCEVLRGHRAPFPVLRLWNMHWNTGPTRGLSVLPPSKERA